MSSQQLSKTNNLSAAQVKLLVIFAASLAVVLLLSNLMAVKLFGVAGFAVDGGILVFPFSYVLSDLLMEFFGQKLAKLVIISSFVLNLLAIFLFWLVIELPPYPNWPHQAAFAIIFGLSPRIILGSLVAFLCSSLLNNYIFAQIKARTGERLFLLRTLGSSAVAKIVDLVIFELIAFYGILSLSEFLGQLLFAYLASLLLELLLSPLSLLLVKQLKKHL